MSQASWRERLLLWCGPGLFAGITLGDWLALLRANRFAVDPRYWWRAAIITLGSLGNSLIRWREESVYGRQLAQVEIQPPIFVLGIWRSGTTHLQNLLSVDPRLATPNWFQVFYPHTFLWTEAKTSWLGGFFVPRQRVQDNMGFGFDLPAEDEIALSIATSFSPMLSWVFPRRADHYDRYLTLRDVPKAEVARWKAALLALVRKLTLKHGKPVVLKSPGHTARIRLLLELFPDARFVHIHRHPYAVIQSSRHTARTLLDYFLLERSTLDLDERAIQQYREVYDAFFAERDLIPADRFHEIRFDDLETDPIGQLGRLYEALRLPDFAVVEPALSDYLATLKHYRRNSYAQLDAGTKQRIAEECQRCFQAWGYPT